MGFNWGSLAPWNWGKDVSSSLEHGLLYLFYNFVKDLLALFSSLIGMGMSAVNGLIGSLVYYVSSLGSFSIPAFVIVLLVIFMGSLDLFKLGKNAPVVGDLL